jgi:hypothetical protein
MLTWLIPSRLNNLIEMGTCNQQILELERPQAPRATMVAKKKRAMVSETSHNKSIMC